jgi:hypothetical protein
VVGIEGSAWLEGFDALYESKLVPSASTSMFSKVSKPSSGAKVQDRHSLGTTVRNQCQYHETEKGAYSSTFVENLHIMG